jgi:hypothetical protein
MGYGASFVESDESGARNRSIGVKLKESRHSRLFGMSGLHLCLIMVPDTFSAEYGPDFILLVT